MDRKLERYYNYIVDDMVKDTKMDFNKERIYLSFSSSIPFHFFPSLSLSLFPPFSTYIQQRYGVRKEETKIIWDLYKERIESIILNG